MSKKRRVFPAEFKAKVALEAIKEQETINQIASRYDVLPAQVSQWKAHMLKSLPGAFKGGGKHKDPEEDWEEEKKQFYQKIGQLEMERDWLKKKSEQFGILPGSKTHHDR
jgi:transposase